MKNYTSIITGIFIFIMCSALHIHAALTVDYDITNDTSWTLANSPVTVTKADFTIHDSATLTIEQDVVVYLVPSSGDVTVNGTLILQDGAMIKVYETVKITVYGTIIANGTYSNKITFDEYNTDQNWDGFYFKKNDSVYKSRFVNTEFKNLDREIAVTEQNVTFDSCSFIADDFQNNLFIRTWGGLTRVDSALLHVKNSSFNITSIYDCSGFGCDRAWIQLDGMDAVIENNTMNYVTAGASINTVNGVSAETSNTEAFTADVKNNTMNITSESNYILCNVYGVNYKEHTVTGNILNNAITLNTTMNAYGIYNYKETLVAYNEINIYKTASNSSQIYGIYDMNTLENCNDKIKGNTIYLTTDSAHRSHYKFTGIYMQSGKAVNNVINIDYNNTTESTSIIGISKNIYPGCIDNNTIKINHPNASDNVKGMFFSNHPDTAETVYVRNNILAGSGVDSTYAFYKDGQCVAKLEHAYNLIYNFANDYFDMIPGTGLVTGDPLFADDSLTLMSASPAIDSGDPSMDYSNEPMPNGGRINIGAYGNTPFAALSETDSFRITVLADPAAAGLMSGGGTYHHNDTATLTASPMIGYHFINWKKDGLEVSTDSVYRFIVTDTGTYTANFELITDMVSTKQPHDMIIIHPNPAKEIINIEFPENIYIQKITLSDITGKTIIEKNKIQPHETIDLSTFNNGIYLIYIETNKGSYAEKIIKL
jgi:hypothetical protein